MSTSSEKHGATSGPEVCSTCGNSIPLDRAVCPNCESGGPKDADAYEWHPAGIISIFIGILVLIPVLFIVIQFAPFVGYVVAGLVFFLITIGITWITSFLFGIERE